MTFTDPITIDISPLEVHILEVYTICHIILQCACKIKNVYNLSQTAVRSGESLVILVCVWKGRIPVLWTTGPDAAVPATMWGMISGMSSG